MTPAPERPDPMDRWPRTAAGGRLFTDNEPMDMLESNGVTWDDIRAVEEEAAAPATDAGLREADQNDIAAAWERGYEARRKVEVALAAAPVTDTALDVERLARVLFRANIGCEAHRSDVRHLASAHREDAAYIAAEYAALSRQAEKETA